MERIEKPIKEYISFKSVNYVNNLLDKNEFKTKEDLSELTDRIIDKAEKDKHLNSFEKKSVKLYCKCVNDMALDKVLQLKKNRSFLSQEELEEIL